MSTKITLEADEMLVLKEILHLAERFAWREQANAKDRHEDDAWTGQIVAISALRDKLNRAENPQREGGWWDWYGGKPDTKQLAQAARQALGK